MWSNALAVSELPETEMDEDINPKIATVIVIIYNVDDECVQIFDHIGNIFKDDNKTDINELLDGFIKK
jgi:hypothetical protein